MTYSQMFVYALEITGTVAFAWSGAMIGIQKKMDVFGVNVLGVTTAVGGGLIRDLILNVTPPMMFLHPSYTLCAVITSTLLFIYAYLNRGFLGEHKSRSDRILLIMDAAGLGTFTVIGINTALELGYTDSRFLLIFVGVITGIGGGMLRDIMAGGMPYVFVKHIYACASIAGAVLTIWMLNCTGRVAAMAAGTVLVILIRVMAAHYQWNLPKIREDSAEKKNDKIIF